MELREPQLYTNVVSLPGNSQHSRQEAVKVAVNDVPGVRPALSVDGMQVVLGARPCAPSSQQQLEVLQGDGLDCFDVPADVLGQLRQKTSTEAVKPQRASQRFDSLLLPQNGSLPWSADGAPCPLFTLQGNSPRQAQYPLKKQV